MGTDAKIPGGYVLLSRALLDSTLWGCGPDALRVATHILLTARHEYKPKKYDGFQVCRGEVVTSFAFIAEGTQWHENRKVRQYSRQKVQRLVEQLERIGFCKRKSDTYGTHLTVCNYEFYQDSGKYKSDNRGTEPDITRTDPDITRTDPGTYNNGEERGRMENNDNTPHSPPKGKRQLTQAQKKQKRVNENTEIMCRIGAWFGRRPETRWNIAEAEALENVDPSDAELTGIEAYYTSSDIPGEHDSRRHSLQTLLNNWQGEMDKARRHYKIMQQGGYDAAMRKDDEVF